VNQENVVSVLIPCCNCEKTINRCIDSILNQTYKNTMIYCADDGSTDNTFKILKQIAEKLGKNKIKIEHHANFGAYQTKKELFEKYGNVND
jgi:glycosyltransferase involved in cell wall biosynthesis